ncbi:hypothetical protein HK098_005671 [Nowakowskiella sp. JEL0407]|nr:hypothetical protein HK098_005671 [Nowakowskiella sp. JEL0407]
MYQKILSGRWIIILATIVFFLFQYHFLLQHPRDSDSGVIKVETPEKPDNSQADSSTCPVCPVIPVTDVSGRKAKILPIFKKKSNPNSLISKLANHGDWKTEWYQKTAKLLFDDEKKGPVHHRKRWEIAYIANAVIELGLCGEGKKGMVWAAGKESLISFFAGMGCSILASDMPPDNEGKDAWADTHQFASSKEDLFVSRFVNRTQFDKLVSYRNLDMNFVPIDLREAFDFMWSTCSVEHVGTIFLGQRFIVDSLSLLKPGGYAIHTTEFTLSSVASTVDSGITVLWRKPDIEYLVKSLKVLGYEVLPVNFNAGTEPFDKKIDLPPYSDDQHIKLQIDRHVTTSFGIIIKKPSSWVEKGPKEYNKCS